MLSTVDVSKNGYRAKLLVIEMEGRVKKVYCTDDTKSFQKHLRTLKVIETEPESDEATKLEIENSIDCQISNMTTLRINGCEVCLVSSTPNSSHLQQLQEEFRHQLDGSPQNGWTCRDSFSEEEDFNSLGGGKHSADDLQEVSDGEDAMESRFCKTRTYIHDSKIDEEPPDFSTLSIKEQLNDFSLHDDGFEDDHVYKNPRYFEIEHTNTITHKMYEDLWNRLFEPPKTVQDASEYSNFTQTSNINTNGIVNAESTCINDNISSQNFSISIADFSFKYEYVSPLGPEYISPNTYINTQLHSSQSCKYLTFETKQYGFIITCEKDSRMITIDYHLEEFSSVKFDDHLRKDVVLTLHCKPSTFYESRLIITCHTEKDSILIHDYINSNVSKANELPQSEYKPSIKRNLVMVGCMNVGHSTCDDAKLFELVECIESDIIQFIEKYEEKDVVIPVTNVKNFPLLIFIFDGRRILIFDSNDFSLYDTINLTNVAGIIQIHPKEKFIGKNQVIYNVLEKPYNERNCVKSIVVDKHLINILHYSIFRKPICEKRLPRILESSLVYYEFVDGYVTRKSFTFSKKKKIGIFLLYDDDIILVRHPCQRPIYMHERWCRERRIIETESIMYAQVTGLHATVFMQPLSHDLYQLQTIMSE